MYWWRTFSSDTLREAIIRWLLVKHLCYRDAELAVARYRGKVPSPQAKDLSVITTTPDYFFNEDDEACWHLVALNAPEQPLEHTILNTKLTKLPEAFCLVDAAIPSSMWHGAGFVLALFSAVFAGASSFIDALRRIAEVFELHISYDLLAAQISSITSECGTSGSFAQDRGNHNIKLRALRGLYKDKFNLLESPFAVMQKYKGAFALAQDACIAKVVRLRRFLFASRKREVASQKVLLRKGFRFYAGRVAPGSKVKNEVSIFCVALFLRWRTASKNILLMRRPLILVLDQWRFSVFWRANMMMFHLVNRSSIIVCSALVVSFRRVTCCCSQWVMLRAPTIP